jgi:serine/threonine-protein kinase
MLGPGDRIGDWIVDAAVAEGGMGAVFRVHSPLTERVVAALKIMKPTADPALRARFVREAEALAALSHPAIVRVMEFAEDAAHGLLYLVMELAVGETLRERIERGPMALDEALAVFLPLARGLEHAHERGVFHRDIKPSNVVLCSDGGVRLVDFGIASAHHAEPITTCQLGTLAYLPPEVFKGEPTEPALVDAYAFGLLLRESLTGERSFPVDPSLTPAAAAAAVGVRKLLQSETLGLGPAFPPRLRTLVERATAPDPAARPGMREIRATLEQLASTRGATSDTLAASPVPRTGAGSPPTPVPARVAAPAPVRPDAAEPEIPEDATTRVPDPAPEPLFGGLRARAPRRLPIAAALAAAGVLGIGALTRFAPSRQDATTAAMVERSAAPPPASPRPDLAASAPPASPRPTPRLRSPSPSASPTAGDDPVPLEPPANESAVSLASAANGLAGRWDVTHRIEATSQEPLAGRDLRYVLVLHQDGDRVFGRGYRYAEDGLALASDARTAIDVEGHVDADGIVLDFVESDASASYAGTIHWRIAPGSTDLRGSFASEAGQSSGTSVARRPR